MKKCLAFDDVRIEPMFLSTKTSRLMVNTNTKIGKLDLSIPLIASPMSMIGESNLIIALEKLGGLGIVHRFMSIEEQITNLNNIRASDESLHRAVSIGVSDNGKQRFDELFKNKDLFSLVCIDVANGFSTLMKEMIDYVKQKSNGELDVMAGNIASVEGYQYLAECGADAVRFGIGSGSRCITAIQTGINKPLFSTIYECKNIHLESYPNVAVIGDGGIRYPSDLVLSIAAGADAIMAGGIFAGCDEASGDIIMTERGYAKSYYGMASFEHQEKYYGNIKDGICAEGISFPVPCSGPIKQTVTNFIGGLKSAMTYLDAENLSDVRKNARFIEISGAALNESHSVGTKK